jgi:hypothetical protein
VAHGTPKNADDFAPLEAPACARKSPFENGDFYKNGEYVQKTLKSLNKIKGCRYTPPSIFCLSRGKNTSGACIAGDCAWVDGGISAVVGSPFGRCLVAFGHFLIIL